MLCFYAPLTDTEIGTLNPRFMEILQLLSVRLSDLWLSFVSSGALLACFKVKQTFLTVEKAFPCCFVSFGGR